MVKRIPPRAFGFSHVGTLKYFTDAGRLEGDVSWWQMFLDRWTFHADGFFDGALEAAEDHSMSGYRKLIEQSRAGVGSAALGAFAGAANATVDILPLVAPQQRAMMIPRRRAA